MSWFTRDRKITVAGLFAGAVLGIVLHVSIPWGLALYAAAAVAGWFWFKRQGLISDRNAPPLEP